MNQNLTIIGLGYIGLPTACVLAEHGHRVYGVDINNSVVGAIGKGQVHIVEPGLEEALSKVVKDGKLSASTKIETPTSTYIIAVPTPFKDEKEPDLSHVESAASSLAPYLKKGDLIILESTSPVGTTRKLSKLLALARKDLVFAHQSDTPDIHIAYCPERILPGKALEELITNDRIIGGITPICAEKAAAIYRSFVKGTCHITKAEVAEMSKLAENAYRDVNIAYANELSLICDELDINVWELIECANHHPRVNILRPGTGVGGHCIAVDPWFIYSKTPHLAKLIKTARDVNESKTEFVIHKLQKKADESEVQKISFLGLSFKPNIDDLRESPSLEIVKTFANSNPHQLISVVEPHIKELPDALKNFKNVRLEDCDTALKNDMVVVLVAHTHFAENKDKIANHPLVFDFQGVIAA